MVGVIVFGLLLVGFGAGAVAVAVVAAALISLIWDKESRHDPRIKRWMTYGSTYLAAYAALWWVGVDLI